jgi:hypothetical protein
VTSGPMPSPGSETTRTPITRLPERPPPGAPAVPT